MKKPEMTKVICCLTLNNPFSAHSVLPFEDWVVV